MSPRLKNFSPSKLVVFNINCYYIHIFSIFSTFEKEYPRIMFFEIWISLQKMPNVPTIAENQTISNFLGPAKSYASPKIGLSVLKLSVPKSSYQI